MNVRTGLSAMMITGAMLVAAQANAADLVGVSNGSITEYMPRLQVQSVIDVNYSGYSTDRDIKKKFKGKYGVWESQVESEIGAAWKKQGAKVCAKSKYYAIANIQRNILVLDRGVFVQMAADIVCGN